MRLKIINGKVYGADLTRKEQEGMKIEIRKQLAEQARQYMTDFDACVLYMIHTKYNKGAKALRSFYDDWKITHDSLVKHYELEKADMPWLYKTKLKDIGVDIEAWNKEENE